MHAEGPESCQQDARQRRPSRRSSPAHPGRAEDNVEWIPVSERRVQRLLCLFCSTGVCLCGCVFITAIPITKLFASTYYKAVRVGGTMCVFIVFITLLQYRVPLTKLGFQLILSLVQMNLIVCVYYCRTYYNAVHIRCSLFVPVEGLCPSTNL